MVTPQPTAAEPRRISIEAPTATLAGYDYGNDGARPLVLLHGLTDIAWSLHPVAQAFADRFHVLSFDLRGHGDSSHPGRYALVHFVADLRTIVTTLGLSDAVLFGHSLGSIVSSWYAGTWPDEPAALVMVEGLGPPPRTGESDPAGRIEIERGYVEAVTPDPARKPMADLDTARRRLRRAHPSLADRLLGELADRGTRPHPDGGLAWKWDPFVRDWSATFTHAQFEDRWRSITCPTMIIDGGQSWERWWKPTSEARPGPGFDGPMAPAERDRRLGCFADVEYHTVDAGHMVHFDAPDEVIALTRSFLDRRL